MRVKWSRLLRRYFGVFLGGWLMLASIVVYLLSSLLKRSPEEQNLSRYALYGITATAILVVVLSAILGYLESGPSRYQREVQNAALEAAEKALIQMANSGVSEAAQRIGAAAGASQADNMKLTQTLESAIERVLREGALKSIDEEFAKRELGAREWESVVIDLKGIRQNI
jgi:hypothetical protein